MKSIASITIQLAGYRWGQVDSHSANPQISRLSKNATDSVCLFETFVFTMTSYYTPA
jgi:hypothetical protein